MVEEINPVRKSRILEQEVVARLGASRTLKPNALEFHGPQCINTRNEISATVKQKRDFI
jgi:hypothetical protein